MFPGKKFHPFLMNAPIHGENSKENSKKKTGFILANQLFEKFLRSVNREIGKTRLNAKIILAKISMIKVINKSENKCNIIIWH